MRRHAAAFNAIYGRRRDGVGIIADVVFYVSAILTNVIGPDNTPIFQMDNVGAAKEHRRNKEEWNKMGPHERILATGQGAN